ncbi:hypothetical protein C8R45DRAFT_930043 [Mycena sanguinolenta]|nr:hypothetical protein C8R45DRAFT_930043 [Mycena sanguinolenta]
MLSPVTPIKQSVFVAFATILLCLPVFMDTILIFRVFMVYPPHTMAWPHRLVIFGPPIVFKILRVANLIVFLVKWTHIVTENLDPVVAGQAAWGSLPWTKIEWFFQVFDNCYASVLFLSWVHQGRVMNARSGVSGAVRVAD